ncbi:hypothetical protein LEP1GSC052_2361 [Leptospira kmetyi serovar Malaysia str. Bejo-Iso9]|nr:hypothetical protein LEP1GSC052_2361 [Leptospira kmetyi serovar Malaysia str. Bejo-Iso9]
MVRILPLEDRKKFPVAKPASRSSDRLPQRSFLPSMENRFFTLDLQKNQNRPEPLFTRFILIRLPLLRRAQCLIVPLQTDVKQA